MGIASWKNYYIDVKVSFVFGTLRVATYFSLFSDLSVSFLCVYVCVYVLQLAYCIVRLHYSVISDNNMADAVLQAGFSVCAVLP